MSNDRPDALHPDSPLWGEMVARAPIRATDPGADVDWAAVRRAMDDLDRSCPEPRYRWLDVGTAVLAELGRMCTEPADSPLPDGTLARLYGVDVREDPELPRDTWRLRDHNGAAVATGSIRFGGWGYVAGSATNYPKGNAGWGANRA